MIRPGTVTGVRQSMLRHRCVSILLGVAVLAVQGQALAGVASRLEKAEKMAREGNFAPAYCIWNPLAKKGNAEAQFNLGWLYRNGDGVAVDKQQAQQLWETAAEKGHAEAQMALGTLYSMERASPENRALAVRWFSAAAEQGFEDALLILLDYADAGDQQALDAVTSLIQQEKVGTRLIVRVDKGNVRTQPSTKATVLITLPRDSWLLKLDDQGDWIRVWVPPLQKTGWVFHSLFE